MSPSRTELSPNTFVLLGALALSGSYFFYIFALSETSYLPDAKWPSWPFIGYYVKGMAWTLIPFILMASAHYIAPESRFVKLFTLITIVITTYFMFGLDISGASNLGLTVITIFVIYWISGFVIFFSSLFSKN